MIRKKKHIKTITLKEINPSFYDKIILEYKEGKKGTGGWGIVGKDMVLRSRRSIVLGLWCSFIIFLIIGPFLSLILNQKIIHFVCAPKFHRFINIDLSLIREVRVVGGGFILKRIIYFILGMFAWITSPFLILNVWAVMASEYYDWNSLKESIEKYGYNPQKFGYIEVVPPVDPATTHRYNIKNGNHRLKIIRDMYGDDYEIDVRVGKLPAFLRRLFFNN